MLVSPLARNGSSCPRHRDAVCHALLTPCPTSLAASCQGKQRAKQLGDGWFDLFFLRTTLRCWKSWVKHELHLATVALSVRANAEVAIRRQSWSRWRFMMEEGVILHRGERVKQAADEVCKRRVWNMWIDEVAAADHYRQR